MSEAFSGDAAAIRASVLHDQDHTGATVYRRTRFVGRPLEVVALSALNLVAAAVTFAATFAPLTMHRIIAAGVICGSLFAATALVAWLFASRFRPNELAIAAIIDLAIISAMVAKALTPQGTILTLFAYLWVTIYAASFFHHRQLVFVLTASVVGSGIALSANGIHRWPAIWVFLLLTVGMIGFTLQRAVEALRREASTDLLTGLLNRRGFVEAVALERSVSERGGFTLALVVIDLDNFKAVNDREGHAAGDRLLVEATSSWTAQLRAGDLLARFGGDEFVLLLPYLSAEEIHAVIDRFRAAHAIAWTAGFAFLERDEPIEHCMARADELLYGAKIRRRAIADS